MIHNIELKPGKGGQLVRSAGGAAQLMAKEGIMRPKASFREMRMVHLGAEQQSVVGNTEHENVTIGKAGRKR